MKHKNTNLSRNTAIAVVHDGRKRTREENRLFLVFLVVIVEDANAGGLPYVVLARLDLVLSSVTINAQVDVTTCGTKYSCDVVAFVTEDGW